MLYQLITNFNFNEVQNYEGPKPEGCDRYYGYKNINNQIIFEANYLACPCIYYIKKDNLFAFSFDPFLVVEFAKQNNISLTDTYDNVKQINDNVGSHIKSSIKKRYKHNLSYIEGWKKVILNSDGNFEIIKNEFIPFQLDIKEHYIEFKNFLLKYKKYIDYLIDKKLFLPTLTGGLDTRYFTGLYRNRVNELDGYFCTSVKQDGKNNYEQGQLEIKLADEVAYKINLKQERFEDLDTENKHYCTITGMFNENADSYKNANDPEYIYKLVQHGYDNTHQYINKLTPFLDDDYLQFKQEGEIIRCLLMILLAPDLLHIPFISGTSLYNRYPDGCNFYPYLNGWLVKVQDILNYWGEEKVKNILN